MRRAFMLFALSFLFVMVGIGHTSVGIRVFSTGACLEDRLAPQPKNFPLKLVLTTKDGHYLAYVCLSIFRDGKLVAKVPSSKVKGPWVYLDLPPGSYVIKGIRKNGAASTVEVKVPSKGMRIVYMRF